MAGSDSNINGHEVSTMLRGTFPVLPTPFADGGEVDLASLQRVVDYVLGCGVDGVVFPGLASEYDQLTKDERLSLTEQIGVLLDGKVPFVVGASAATPELAIEFAIAGENAGAACAMVLAPAALASDLTAMERFFEKLAGSTAIPIMLQNAPAPMGAGLSVKNVVKILQKVPRIEYVKEETMPCGQRIEQIIARAPKSLKGVFGGAGGRHVIDELNRGSLGTFPASEVTEVHAAVVKAHRQNDSVKARDLFQRMLPILNMQAVYRCSLTKEVLRQRGFVDSAMVRAPGPVMDQRDIEELRVYWQQVEEFSGPLMPASHR